VVLRCADGQATYGCFCTLSVHFHFSASFMLCLELDAVKSKRSTEVLHQVSLMSMALYRSATAGPCLQLHQSDLCTLGHFNHCHWLQP
jgi:hypothetical protein